jgi:hypothetical protein
VVFREEFVARWLAHARGNAHHTRGGHVKKAAKKSRYLSPCDLSLPTATTPDPTAGVVWGQFCIPGYGLTIRRSAAQIPLDVTSGLAGRSAGQRPPRHRRSHAGRPNLSDTGFDQPQDIASLGQFRIAVANQGVVVSMPLKASQKYQKDSSALFAAAGIFAAGETDHLISSIASGCGAGQERRLARTRHLRLKMQCG